MKRIASICLVLALLVSGAMTAVAGAEGEFRFSRENFPRMDGSTSMVPLGQAIASVLLGESREDAADLIHFNRTTQSFRNLRMGDCDVVIAAEPKSEVFDEMADEAFPYLMETIAKEALVFVVNADNPVDSLTREQVRDIYSGAITSWSQVGGADLPIEAFQRNPSAGSQVMMEKLVMDGTPLMEAPSTRIPQEMGELIEAVRSFDNSANAIGYTVYYYASDMQMADGLKILKIDDIQPEAETIRSGAYPYINGYYCCINAMAAQDSPERRLFDWLVTEAGQELLTLEGYVSVYAPGEASKSGSDVERYYENYIPNSGMPAVYTLFDCPHDHLEPSGDYGKIYPYDGSRLFVSWGDDSQDYEGGSMKGFYNHDGQLITNPIYTGIYRNTYDEWVGQDYFWVVTDADNQKGIVSPDGSTVTETVYEIVNTISDKYILAIRDYERVQFDLYDRDFQLIGTQADFIVDGMGMMPLDEIDGKWICNTLDVTWWGDEYSSYECRYYLLDAQKRILLDSDNYFSVNDFGHYVAYDEDWHATVLDENLNPVQLGDCTSIDSVEPLGARFYHVYADSYSTDFICDRNGGMFEWDYDQVQWLSEDWFGVIRDGKLRVYDQNGRVMLDGIPSAWENVDGRYMFTEYAEDALIFHLMPEDKTLCVPYGRYAMKRGDNMYSVVCTEDDQWYTCLVRSDLSMTDRQFAEVELMVDFYTGEQFLQCFDTYAYRGEQYLYALDGETELFHCVGAMSMEDGFITVTGDWAYTCYDKDGNVIFCYPYYGMGSGD